MAILLAFRSQIVLAPPFLLGAVDYPFVTLQCAANSNEWDLASLAITKLGTVEDSRVVAVKLYYDVDQDGVADTGDTAP